LKVAKWLNRDTGKPREEKNGYSPFCNETVVLCSDAEFLDLGGKLGLAPRMYSPEEEGWYWRGGASEGQEKLQQRLA